MSVSQPLVAQLLINFPNWRPQMYFKSSLTALSHAMEDRVLADSDDPLVIASFQKERYYRQEAHRYSRIAAKTDQVYVLAAPEAEFKNSSKIYETIAFNEQDSLNHEWHLIVIGKQYSCCLICGEKTNVVTNRRDSLAMEASRRFEGIWTFDPQVTVKAAELLLARILVYRPELGSKIERARQTHLFKSILSKKKVKDSPTLASNNPSDNPDPFVQRLVSYLQASQYKLLKANKSLAAKQQKERLLNSVTASIRRSLNTEEILQVAVQELGEGLQASRCIVYRCHEDDDLTTINHEFTLPGVASLQGQTWHLKNNPLFEQVINSHETLIIESTKEDERLHPHKGKKKTTNHLANLVEQFTISSWLLTPVLYQDHLLGMVELHYCEKSDGEKTAQVWQAEDVVLVDAIATQIGVALIQAEAYANLQDLNEQLEALDRTRSNLVAITGHELRTPLSTIQVCLESLATEPDMSLELRQIMLNTALGDAERMRNLVQDFLTLSRLESGRVDWHPVPLSIAECIDLALSNVRARSSEGKMPKIKNLVSPETPLVRADGEWLVEVLAKLLDNACKFTSGDGQISIIVEMDKSNRLEVTIADTGKGIEPHRLETVFDRFYQEEGSLRRSSGGTGLGLAICRQIVKGWGGSIWAESAGKNQGCEFHFTIPVFDIPPQTLTKRSPLKSPKSKRNKSKKSS